VPSFAEDSRDFYERGKIERGEQFERSVQVFVVGRMLFVGRDARNRLTTLLPILSLQCASFTEKGSTLVSVNLVAGRLLWKTRCSALRAPCQLFVQRKIKR
jgi:hypothetical protein